MRQTQMYKISKKIEIELSGESGIRKYSFYSLTNMNWKQFIFVSIMRKPIEIDVIRAQLAYLLFQW